MNVLLFCALISTIWSLQPGAKKLRYKSSVRWIASDQYVATFVVPPHTNLGFQTDEKHVVSSLHVHNEQGNGIAADSGLIETGDTLERVNGIDVRSFDLEEIRLLMKKFSTPEVGQIKMTYELQFRKSLGAASENEPPTFDIGMDNDCHLHVVAIKSNATSAAEDSQSNAVVRFSAIVPAASAKFGHDLEGRTKRLRMVSANPVTGCFARQRRYDNDDDSVLMLVRRGGCSFLHKAEMAEKSGAAGLVVWNDNDESPTIFRMESDASTAKNSIDIPVAMIARADGERLVRYVNATGLTLWCVLETGSDKVLSHALANMKNPSGSLFQFENQMTHEVVPEFGDRLRLFFRGKIREDIDLMPATFSGPFPSGHFAISILRRPACSESSIDPAHVKNRVVVVPRGVCSFGQKVHVLESLGASAVVVSNNHGDDLFRMQQETWRPARVRIAVAMISANDAKVLQIVKPISRARVALICESCELQEGSSRIETQDPSPRPPSATNIRYGATIEGEDDRRVLAADRRVLISAEQGVLKSEKVSTEPRDVATQTTLAKISTKRIQKIDVRLFVRFRSQAKCPPLMTSGIAFVPVTDDSFENSAGANMRLVRLRLDKHETDESIGQRCVIENLDAEVSLRKSWLVISSSSASAVVDCSISNVLIAASAVEAVGVLLPKNDSGYDQSSMPSLSSARIVMIPSNHFDVIEKRLQQSRRRNLPHMEPAISSIVYESANLYPDSTILWEELWELSDLSRWPSAEKLRRRLYRSQRKRQERLGGSKAAHDKEDRVGVLECVYGGLVRNTEPQGSIIYHDEL